MKHLIATAFAFALLTVSGAAYAGGDQAGFQCVSKPCYTTKEVTRHRTVGYEEVVVRRPIKEAYKKKVRVKVPCKVDCAPPPPEKVQAPPPKTVTVEQIVYVRTVNKYVPIPAPPVIVQQRRICCPQGQYIPGLPPCPPGHSGYGNPQQMYGNGGRQNHIRTAAAPQLPSKTDEGLRVHAPRTAPDGSQPCQRMVNGVLMTGKCW